MSHTRTPVLRALALILFFLACTLPGASSTPEPPPGVTAGPPTTDTPAAPTPTDAPPATDTPAPADTAAPAGPPDWILYNGGIVTMDPAQPSAAALAIVDDVILALGDDAEILALAGPETRMLDLGGRTVYPGFIDSHSHWIGDRELGGFSAAEDVVRHVVSLGWTSINELFVSQERLDELLALDAAGDLPLRVNAYLPVNFTDDKFGDWYLAYPPGTELSPHVRVAGIKLFMDHDWGQDIHWSQEELDGYVIQAHANGYQVAAHTVGHEALDLLLAAFTHALETSPDADPRFRIEHALQVRDDQLPLIVDTGAYASIQLPGPANWSVLPSFQERLEDEPVEWLMRWRDIMSLGIPMLGSTDWPWTTPEGFYEVSLTPFLSIYMEAARDGYEHIPVADYHHAQALSVEEGLRLLTVSGAYGTFEEGRKGSLAPGKWADLVVLSADPAEVPLEELPGVLTLLTMVGGEVAYDGGGLVNEP